VRDVENHVAKLVGQRVEDRRHVLSMLLNEVDER
jgi:hypothetical protein